MVELRKEIAMKSQLTRPVPPQPVVAALRQAAAEAPPGSDGMVSISSARLVEAADYIERLIDELCSAQGEASEAGAELSGLAGEHFTREDVVKYGQRDARLASRTLSSLIKRIGDFFPETA